MADKKASACINHEEAQETKALVQRLMEEGARCYDSGDFSRAIASFTEVIEHDPANASAYYWRGWARAHVGDIQGEQEDWSKAIELNPNFDAAFAARAAGRMAQRDVQGALTDWKKAIELNPEQRSTIEPLLQRIQKQLDEATRPENGHAEQLLTQDDEKSLGVDRRDFLRVIGGVAVSTVALTIAGCGTRATSSKESAVKWGMIIDLRRCVGCKACTIACKAENHTPPGVAYNVVMEEEVGEYPNVTRRFLPRPCMQCANSSCTTVCPTGATYHRPDGIVVVDYDRCIGCRYCIAACPYGARSFDYGHNYAEHLNPHERQPSPEYGQYRKREKGKSPIGNVRKCTFCLHRLVNGLNPACAETCIGHAIHFGDLNDPDGKCTVHGEKLRELLATRSHMRLKEELGNDPSVYYLT